MKYIASVSFGKDSLAMLLRLIEENYPLDAVVFYNSGMEFDAIYRVRDKVKHLLMEHGIEYVELIPDDPFLYCMFDKKIKYRNKPGYHYGAGWCGGPCRWATYYKIKAIRRYKRELGEPVIDYVGIASDEEHRFEKQKSKGKVMPLVDWQMTEADCLKYCHDRGWFWMENSPTGEIELYEILDRVSCWCCANKNLRELKNMFLYLPEYWGKLRNLQTRLDKPMKGEGKSVFDLEMRFMDENK